MIFKVEHIDGHKTLIVTADGIKAMYSMKLPCGVMAEMNREESAEEMNCGIRKEDEMEDICQELHSVKNDIIIQAKLILPAFGISGEKTPN